MPDNYGSFGNHKMAMKYPTKFEMCPPPVANAIKHDPKKALIAVIAITIIHCTLIQ